jgi:hypothetical protein
MRDTASETLALPDEEKPLLPLFLIDSRAPPARSALRATSLAARASVQNSYKLSLFYKIQNSKFKI